MGRISDIGLYPFDTAITPSDYVIGTDGDSLNATKNFKMSTMLGYLGNMFNLQSQDLYYTYNAVESGSVGIGEISSNNYADGTILMSGITNLYVSKLTELGALVDTYLNAIATDQLTFILMDLSAPQNYAICTLTGSSDVDANTINLALTVGATNGELVQGRSIGLKLTATGGGGDNLGDHIATQNLNMSEFDIINAFRVGSSTNTVEYIYADRYIKGVDGTNYWVIDHAATDKSMAFGYINTSPEGTFSALYRLNSTGTPASPLDLITKQYADANYGSTVRSAWVNELAQTAPTNVGSGLGDIDVGASLTLPTDTQTGDMFHVYYSVSWSPRNGKSINDDNIDVRTMQTAFAGDVFDRATNPLLSLTGTISMDVHITYTVIDAINGDYSQLTTVKMMDFITTSNKYMNMDASSVSGAGDMTDGTFVIHATIRYADDLTSEGTITRGKATIVRVNNG